MKTMLATPAYAGFKGCYNVGLMGSQGAFDAWLPGYGQADIYVVRNSILNTFLNQSDFDTLIFVDSDIGFTRENLQALIATPERFVSGLYPTKGTNPEWVFKELGGGTPERELPLTGLREVQWIPTGFLKVHRDVLDAVIKSGQVASYGKGKCWQFVNGVIHNDYLLSEDYSFAEIVRRAGIKAYVNLGISLEHDGTRLR
jgi:hypothetical protein